LLEGAGVGKTVVIRHRMLYIVLLGALASALSLVALERAFTLTEAQRDARARDAVTAEVERLAQLPPTAQSLQSSPATTYVGLHAGWVNDPPDLSAVPESWRPTVADAVRTHALREAPLGSSRLIATARQMGDATLWAGVLLQPSAYLRPWRWIVVVLAFATALLVATALRSAWVFRKNASALHTTLVALGKDLSTPVPPPSIGELAGIADGIRALASDLQMARDAEERLSRELAHKERLAALGRVAAGMAHEVRNPLASIKLRLDLTAASLPEASRPALAAASEEIVRLDRLVSDLLLVAGNKQGPRRPVELGALAQARAEALSPWSAERGVAIHVGGAGQAIADPDSLARALDNVLRNAVEASPQKSAVEVKVAVENDHVEVRVDDRGGGVREENQLFEPFFTTKADGTGLGLAISRAIARAHGGELTYVRLGDVTRFSLSLPRGPA
jgi:signal transduction histidine kinase